MNGHFKTDDRGRPDRSRAIIIPAAPDDIIHVYRDFACPASFSYLQFMVQTHGSGFASRLGTGYAHQIPSCAFGRLKGAACRGENHSYSFLCPSWPLGV